MVTTDVAARSDDSSAKWRRRRGIVIFVMVIGLATEEAEVYDHGSDRY